jgi:hypothetical protein
VATFAPALAAAIVVGVLLARPRQRAGVAPVAEAPA